MNFQRFEKRVGQNDTQSNFKDLEMKQSKVSFENLGVWCFKLNN